MAFGTDLWWADAAVRAGLELHAYVPFPQQTSTWRSQDDVDEWRRLRGLAAQVETLYDYPADQFLHARNRAMLAAATAAVCVYIPGRRGGTYNAIIDAHRILPPPASGVFINPVRRRTSLGLPSAIHTRTLNGLR